MSKVFLDDGYQSISEKTHPQAIRGGERWDELRWVDEAGKTERALMTQREGPQDYDYSARVDPQAEANLVWFRVQRHPIITGDNGTHWQGPFRTTPGEPFNITGHALDSLNGRLGKGYGASVKAKHPCRISTFIAKLDPRR